MHCFKNGCRHWATHVYQWSTSVGIERSCVGCIYIPSSDLWCIVKGWRCIAIHVWKAVSIGQIQSVENCVEGRFLACSCVCWVHLV